MSHARIHPSPLGTPTTDRTVGEMVAENPSLSRIFQAFEIDFCCQGGRTVREACEKKGLSPDEVANQLEQALRDTPAPKENPAMLPPAELADHIVNTHHNYLRNELPRLQAMAQRVAQVHGPHTPSLVELLGVFEGMSAELSNHMMKEEEILFPAIHAMAGGQVLGSLDGPIMVMLQEHDEAGAALARMRELTRGFTPPADACNTYRALFAGLAELEEDLHRHIHLENSVLFPAARDMAAA